MKVICYPPGPVEIDLNAMPKCDRDRLCRIVLRATARLFEDPKVQAEYERWREEYRKTGKI